MSFVRDTVGLIRMRLQSVIERRRQYRQRTFSLGTRGAFQWNKALELAAMLEDQEILRKLALGK
jgi:hypothetical protein